MSKNEQSESSSESSEAMGLVEDDDTEQPSESLRRSSLMQRTDTILERIDTEGLEAATDETLDSAAETAQKQSHNGDQAEAAVPYTSLSAGCIRSDLFDDELSETMTSSLVCTDGSDVEVLSDIGDALDNQDRSDVLETSVGALALNDNSNGALKSREINSMRDQNINYSHFPIEAIVNVENKPTVDTDRARLMLEKAESRRSSDSGSPPASPNTDHVVLQDSLSSMSASLDSSTLSHDSPTQRMSESATPAELQMLSNGVNSRPDSLSLPRPLQSYERHKKLVRSESKSSSCSNYSHSSTEALIEAATCTPLHAQGKITRQGDSIEFVAEDLSEMIRMSSPLSKREQWLMSRASSSRSISSVSSSASGLSTSSASGWSALSNASGQMSRSPSVMTQSPEDIPPIDPRAMLELEVKASHVAASLDNMLGNLHNNLHKMSSLSVSCVDAYAQGIDRTCDSVDASIKSMYALMAKCEELSHNIQPVYTLRNQIKEIKRLLDMFEAQVNKEDKASTP